MYEDIYGLSCIENHVLAILRERGEEIDYLYHDSAVPLSELYQSIVINGVRQEYFDKIRRIQDLLKELGIISLVKVQDKSPKKMAQYINNCGKDEYILLRVTREFTKASLFARGFREDHYVLIEPDNDDYIIYNDIPERTLSIAGKQLKEIYDGDYFVLKILRTLTDCDINKLWDSRKYKPAAGEFIGLNGEDFEGIENYKTKLRGLLGVYKTLCLRMFRYYGKYIDMDFFKELIYRAGKYYSLLEYYNLKNVDEFDKYNDIFQELAAIDNKTINQLTKQLEVA